MQLRGLSFVEGEVDHGLDMWSVQESGLYVRDNQMGRAYADELIAAMSHMSNLCLLTQVSRVILKKGRFGGVEVGFSQRIAERLIPAA